MDQIYQNGFCNISASNATTFDQGLFFERNLAVVTPHRLDHDGTQLWIFAGRLSAYRAVDACVLNRRGWVFQERVLSRRNISFTRDWILFECAEKSNYDTQPPWEDDTSSMRYNDFVYALRSNGLAHRDPNSSLPSSLSQEPEYLWTEIVTAYSSKNLTVPGDRLAALSGIAHILETMTG